MGVTTPKISTLLIAVFFAAAVHLSQTDSLNKQKGNAFSSIRINSRSDYGNTGPAEGSRFIGPMQKSKAHVTNYTMTKGYASNDIDAVLLDPPPHEEVAKMARYVVAHSNWTSMATISTRAQTLGFPFANVFSVSDGTAEKSSGIPYMFVTPLDISIMDLQKDPRASLTMSLAQSDYCEANEYDPEDPRCAHIILTGTIQKVLAGSAEYKFAKEALFSRHSAMAGWPTDHGWFFAKLKIRNIVVLDYFGGAKTVGVDEYFKAG